MRVGKQQENIEESFIALAYNNNIEVEHSPHCPKVKGLSLTLNTGTLRGKQQKRVLLKTFYSTGHKK